MGHEDEETEKGRWGKNFLLKNDMNECDKGKKMNPME
jgi:hypothetical protein